MGESEREGGREGGREETGKDSSMSSFQIQSRTKDAIPLSIAISF